MAQGIWIIFLQLVWMHSFDKDRLCIGLDCKAFVPS